MPWNMKTKAQFGMVTTFLAALALFGVGALGSINIMGFAFGTILAILLLIEAYFLYGQAK